MKNKTQKKNKKKKKQQQKQQQQKKKKKNKKKKNKKKKKKPHKKKNNKKNPNATVLLIHFGVYLGLVTVFILSIRTPQTLTIYVLKFEPVQFTTRCCV